MRYRYMNGLRYNSWYVKRRLNALAYLLIVLS
jgi:hypothetical protein